MSILYSGVRVNKDCSWNEDKLIRLNTYAGEVELHSASIYRTRNNGSKPRKTVGGFFILCYDYLTLLYS